MIMMQADRSSTPKLTTSLRLALLLTFSALSLPLLAQQLHENNQGTVQWRESIDFTESREITSNLTGQLSGEIAFIQNTLVGPKRGQQERPLLVTDRAALLLFFPSERTTNSYRVTVKNRAGQSVTLSLAAPWNAPKNDSINSDGRPQVVFSKRVWTTLIPWNWMHPGMEISVQEDPGNSGRLQAEDFEFGPPIELVTQHVEIGMLLSPSSVQANQWCNPSDNLSPELALDYFQMVPISKFTAAQYLPIYFPKVVLPNGNVYTDRSTFEGAGVYKGDMRQQIAKGMVSTGINYANIGVPSSIGGTEKQPRPFRQTTVHTSAGVYTEKDETGNAKPVTVRHGLSGGGGQLTLLNTTGNEFSHEYGHDHGLPHYPGGKELSAHSRNGAWGYNIFKNRFIGNLDWNGKRPDAEFPYGFGKDAMAGGKPLGAVSVFTHHTPFSLKMIQDKVGSESGVLSDNSPSGYQNWDSQRQTMVDMEVEYPKPDRIGVPVMTLLGMYDPIQPSERQSFIYPALYGNWGNAFSPSTIKNSNPDLAQTRCTLEVTDEQKRIYRFPLHDERLDPNLMNQFHVNLPSSVQYTEARIVFQGEKPQVINQRQIEPPKAKLPEPVIVGKQIGFTSAAVRLRTMETFLTVGGYTNPDHLRETLEDYYGQITDYRQGTTFEAGRVYRKLDGSYYQAMLASPTDTQFTFRKLGETKPYLSRQRLELGQLSKDYAKVVMKGKSGVYYYVPIDRTSVTQSDAPSAESAAWYAKGSYSTVTVITLNADETQASIVLRGQINDSHVINRGAPVTESSRIRFTYHPDDNPDLAPGNYRISFPVFAQAWHVNQLVEAFRVVGVIRVRN
ncbi:M66 family metalloprotease [bacterium]|nr:M66 family metalloprotease [bacterium]